MTQTVELNLPNAGRTLRVLDEVAAECARQHGMPGRVRLVLLDPAVRPFFKWRLLVDSMEQVETEIEILTGVSGPAEPLSKEELRSSLLRLAANAVAFAESLTPNTEDANSANSR